MQALACLDHLLARKKNQRALLAGLQEDFDQNPAAFFRNIVMPLLPRDARLSVDPAGVVQWRSLLGGEDGLAVSEGLAGGEVPLALLGGETKTEGGQ